MQVLLVPRLQTLMVFADRDRMLGFLPGQLGRSHDNGIPLLLGGFVRRTNAPCGCTRCRPNADSSACLIPSKARLDSSFQTRAFWDLFLFPSRLPFEHGRQRGCILDTHLDIPRVVVAEPQIFL